MTEHRQVRASGLESAPYGAQGEGPIDPFDPDALRVTALADVNVEKILTAAPIRRPGRTEFFRVHPEFMTDTLVLEREDGMNRETYLVQREVQDLVVHELRPVRLFVAINKRGTVFLWPAKLPLRDRVPGTADRPRRSPGDPRTRHCQVGERRG